MTTQTELKAFCDFSLPARWKWGRDAGGESHRAHQIINGNRWQISHLMNPASLAPDASSSLHISLTFSLESLGAIHRSPWSAARLLIHLFYLFSSEENHSCLDSRLIYSEWARLPSAACFLCTQGPPPPSPCPFNFTHMHAHTLRSPDAALHSLLKNNLLF